jgi:hypothetical protein
MVLEGKAERKKSLARPRHRWEDKNKINLQKEGCRNMDWIELVQDRER